MANMKKMTDKLKSFLLKKSQLIQLMLQLVLTIQWMESSIS